VKKELKPKTFHVDQDLILLGTLHEDFSCGNINDMSGFSQFKRFDLNIRQVHVYI
jgi:hypothetical protein